MKETISNRLLALVKSREKCYEYASKKYGHMQLSKLKAITKIRSTLEHYMTASISTQYLAILRLKQEIFEIIPSDQSKYRGVRQDMLGIIEEANLTQ